MKIWFFLFHLKTNLFPNILSLKMLHNILRATLIDTIYAISKTGFSVGGHNGAHNFYRKLKKKSTEGYKKFDFGVNPNNPDADKFAIKNIII